MRFYGATRCEAGKAMNEDAFACLGDWAILLDGAGDAKGAAKGCIDFLVARLEACPNLALSELIGIANQFLLGTNQECTVIIGASDGFCLASYRLALHLQSSALLTAVQTMHMVNDRIERARLAESVAVN